MATSATNQFDNMIVAQIFLDPIQDDGLAYWNADSMMITDVLQTQGVSADIFDEMEDAIREAIDEDDDLIQKAKIDGAWYTVAFTWDYIDFPDICPDGPWRRKHFLRLIRLDLCPD